jgi:hypothetical protein
MNPVLNILAEAVIDAKRPIELSCIVQMDGHSATFPNTKPGRLVLTDSILERLDAIRPPKFQSSEALAQDWLARNGYVATKTEEVITEADIASAVHDFVAYITTRPEKVEVGGDALTPPVLELFQKWAEERALDLSKVDLDWVAKIS